MRTLRAHLGARASDHKTRLGQLAIAVGTACVDLGFRLQSINLDEQDEIGGVTIWVSEADGGVRFAWKLHYFTAIRWPRGDVNQPVAQARIRAAISDSLQAMGFTIVHTVTGDIVKNAPNSYLEPVESGSP